jgi:hypothetical protein
MSSTPKLLHDHKTVVADSGDGVVSITVVKSPRGVHARRSHIQAGRGRVELCVSFDDCASFEQWCAADRLQHHYPLVYQHVIKSGRALFEQRWNEHAEPA